ncbi:MAG: hypothetical protein ACI93T_002600 [Porticoccaceae bacterium]|jgi:hypothetical protein
MRFKLSWTRGRSRGNVDNPTWHAVERELSSSLWSSGSIQLDVLDRAEIGPVCLQAYSDRGMFVVMLGENTDDDYDVRTPYDANREDRMVGVLGNEWDNRTVVTDRRFVESVFHQFFHDGTVSESQLS